MGLERESDAGVPIEHEKEQLLRMATFLFSLPSPITFQRHRISRMGIELVKELLLLSAFPRSDFAESRASDEAGLLLSEFPGGGFFESWSFKMNELFLPGFP